MGEICQEQELKFPSAAVESNCHPDLLHRQFASQKNRKGAVLGLKLNGRARTHSYGFSAGTELVMCWVRCFSSRSRWQPGSCSLPACAQRGVQGVGCGNPRRFALCIWGFQSSPWSYKGIEVSAKWHRPILELASGFAH